MSLSISKSYELFIANRWRASTDGREIPSINPTTEEPWTAFAAATAEDVDAAVIAAHEAFENGPWPHGPS
jgi:acyl-CoA reductase-like NAD-dependent aldehyde dehydrogenase